MTDHAPQPSRDELSGPPDPPDSARRTTMHDRTASDVWAASASFGRSLGILLLLLASGSAIVSLLEFRDAEGRQRLAWLVIAIMFVALALGVGVLLRGLRTMRYRLTDESLIVEWMGSDHGVPSETILDVT